MVIVVLGRTGKSSEQYQEAVVVMGWVQKTINVDATLQPDRGANIATELPTLIEWVGADVNNMLLTSILYDIY